VTARALPYVYGTERGELPKSLEGCKLAFPGGVTDTSSFVESHPNGETPTTTARMLMLRELDDAAAFVTDARKLIEQGRSGEARFELQMAARHIANALLWCEP
jgi:hypothetical protein